MLVMLPLCKYPSCDNIVSSQNGSHVEVCSSSYLIFFFLKIRPHITTLPDFLYPYYLYNIHNDIVMLAIFVQLK